jgi:hypothetical protein
MIGQTRVGLEFLVAQIVQTLERLLVRVRDNMVFQVMTHRKCFITVVNTASKNRNTNIFKPV